MIKLLIRKLIGKYGALGALMKVGDIIVGITKSKKDDKNWAKIKKVIKGFSA